MTSGDPNGPANMIATALFWTVGLVVLIGIGWTWDRFTTRRLGGHVGRALDNGDARIRAALDEIEDYANSGVEW